MATEERALKEGERVLAPSRRPDGTLRKPVRIRAGFTPQDEVAIYQSKGSQLRTGVPQPPPGYDPADFAASKAKTKAAKKNEKRKEKKQQRSAGVSSSEPGGVVGDGAQICAPEAVAQQLDALTIAASDVGHQDLKARRRGARTGIEDGAYTSAPRQVINDTHQESSVRRGSTWPRN